MRRRYQHDPQTAALGGEVGLPAGSELSLLRDVFRLLPTGVTVQDEQGRFLLVNDAAATQLGIAAGEPAAPDSKELTHRRKTGLELLRAGHPAVTEEQFTNGE